MILFVLSFLYMLYSVYDFNNNNNSNNNNKNKNKNNNNIKKTYESGYRVRYSSASMAHTCIAMYVKAKN